MTADPEQQPGTKAKCGTGWFRPGSILVGFFLGGTFVSSAFTLLHIHEPRQILEVTNTGSTPLRIHHDAAAFWNSGELTIAPGRR